MIKFKIKKGYKYQLQQDVELQTPFLVESVDERYFSLDPEGLLTIREGYAWDGASGPAVDDQTNLTQSCVHDVFCQMVEMNFVKLIDRERVDWYFRELLGLRTQQDGVWKRMSKWRRQMYYVGVRLGEKFYRSGVRKIEILLDDQGEFEDR